MRPGNSSPIAERIDIHSINAIGLRLYGRGCFQGGVGMRLFLTSHLPLSFLGEPIKGSGRESGDLPHDTLFVGGVHALDAQF